MVKEIGKKLLIVLVIIIAIVFMVGVPVFGANLLSSGAEQYDEYYRLEDTCVTVTAKITSMKEKDDGDGGTDYVTYITYSYNGATFRDVKYKTFGSDKHFGEQVQIEIDPQNPAHLRPDHSGMTQIVLGGLIILFGAIAATVVETNVLSARKVKNNWQDTYSTLYLNTRAVQMDLDCENHYKKHYSVIISGVVLVLFLSFLAHNYIETNTFTAPIAYGVTLLLFIVFGFVYYILHNGSEVEVYLVTDQLLCVTTEEDSDGNKTDVWSFSCCSRWIPQSGRFVTISGRTLSDIRVGSLVYIALNKHKKIERVYDAKEFKM